MEPFMRFDGQVCLITGAGSEAGIGYACAERLGSLGAQIIITSTSERIHERVAELHAKGIASHGYIADLTEKEQVERLVSDIIQNHGRIDVLVNNAGLAQLGQRGASQAFAHTDLNQWCGTIDRNLTTCFLVTRQVLPAMIQAGYGRIVNISSVTGPLVSTSHSAAYGAAKAAVVGMSRAIAIEAAKDNIMINNVLPGWIATDAQSKRGAEGGRNTPAGRSGTAREVANLAVFLASKEASYITGQTFVVDGGNTIQEYKGPAEKS